jgi:hypothetical protein
MDLFPVPYITTQITLLLCCSRVSGPEEKVVVMLLPDLLLDQSFEFQSSWTSPSLFTYEGQKLTNKFQIFLTNAQPMMRCSCRVESHHGMVT